MFKWNSRKIHLWAGMIFSIPALVIFSTGVLLQLKNDLPWIQPEVKKAAGREMNLTIPEILELARTVPGANVQSWSEIAQVDWRPDRGLIRLRTKDWIEIQIDAHSRTVLNSGKRWTALIIALHEGSWWSPAVKYGVFLPTALALWLLWVTGVLVGLKVFAVKWKNRQRRNYA